MKITITILCAALALVLPLRAAAALGGGLDSVEADRAQLRGTVHVAHMSTHSVHQIRTASGVMVNEYVSPAGEVFAVSWQGPANPDLRQVLGNYYDQFLQAARSRTQVRGPLLIRQSGLVVQMSGTMRAHFGCAYIPQKLPAQMQPENIR